MEKGRKFIYIISILLIVISYVVCFPISTWSHTNYLYREKVNEYREKEDENAYKVYKLLSRKQNVTYKDLEDLVRFFNLRSINEILNDSFSSPYLKLRDSNAYSRITKVPKYDILRIEFRDGFYYLVKNKIQYSISRNSYTNDSIKLILTKYTVDEYYRLYTTNSWYHSTYYNTGLPEKYYDSNACDFMRNENSKDIRMDLKLDIIFDDFIRTNYSSNQIKLTNNSDKNIYANLKFGLYDERQNSFMFKKDRYYYASWEKTYYDTIFADFLSSDPNARELLENYINNIYIDFNG